MKRTLRSLALIVASSLVLVGLGSPPASSQAVGPTAGEWTGYYIYEANATFDTDEGDVPVRYSAEGTFDFVTANGFLSGGYELLVEAELTELGTTANAVASGDLSGPATEPDMVLSGTNVASAASGITRNCSKRSTRSSRPATTTARSRRSTCATPRSRRSASSGACRW